MLSPHIVQLARCLDLAQAIPVARVFKVEVTVLPRCPFYPNECVLATVFVDGKDAGICHVLNQPGSKICNGFHVRKDAATTVISAFQFADAERQEGTAELKDDYSEGKVTATFEWVTPSSKKLTFTPGADVPQPSRTPAVPEGKKFFLAPSLVTKAGEKKVVSVNWSNHSYSKICSMETVELRYETASTLELRRVLRRDNPVHKALLDAEAVARGGVPDQAEQEDEEQAQRESGPGPSSSNPRFKRERGSTAAPGPAIDLTGGMQRPRCDPNMVEACELTADEEAPQWSAKKRAVAGVL